jgi:hypothetical protein
LSLIEEHGVRVGHAIVTYPAYLAVGMIGFSVMNSSTVAGSIIWNVPANTGNAVYLVDKDLFIFHIRLSKIDQR